MAPFIQPSSSKGALKTPRAPASFARFFASM